MIAADGQTAVETNKIDWFAANFGGGQSQGSDGPFTLDYDMTIDPSGLIRMDGEIFGEDVEYTLFGFAQEGGRVLILSKAIAEGGDNAGDLAVVIAVETDPAPVFGADSGNFSGVQAGTYSVFENDVFQESVTLQSFLNVDLPWNGTTVKTNKIEVNGNEGSWLARATNGSVYVLREDGITNVPPLLFYPVTPLVGQSWTSVVNGEARELEVINLDETSPGGITGCVVIREISPDDWSEDIFLKDGALHSQPHNAHGSEGLDDGFHEFGYMKWRKGRVEEETSNIGRPTLNIVVGKRSVFDVRCSMFDVRCSMFDVPVFQILHVQ